MSEYWDQVEKILSRSLENIAQSMFDDYIKKNAEFRSKAGLSPKIIRKMHGETCEWCRALAGTYEYGEEPDEVYQRHDNCDCTVEYVTEKGKQDVWTKAWDKGKIEARKTIGLNPYARTANMPPEEFARAKELWRKNEELPLSQKEREYIYEELDNNLTIEEKEQCIVRRAIGNYWYTAIHMGHNQYKIISKKPILETTGDMYIDQILDEVLDFDWRKLL